MGAAGIDRSGIRVLGEILATLEPVEVTRLSVQWARGAVDQMDPVVLGRPAMGSVPKSLAAATDWSKCPCAAHAAQAYSLAQDPHFGVSVTDEVGVIAAVDAAAAAAWTAGVHANRGRDAGKPSELMVAGYQLAVVDESGELDGVGAAVIAAACALVADVPTDPLRDALAVAWPDATPELLDTSASLARQWKLSLPELRVAAARLH